MAVAMKTAMQHVVPVVSYVMLSVILAAVMRPNHHTTRAEGSVHRRDSDRSSSSTDTAATVTTTTCTSSTSSSSPSSSKQLVNNGSLTSSLPQPNNDSHPICSNNNNNNSSNSSSNNNNNGTDDHGEKLVLLFLDFGVTLAVGTLAIYVSSRIWTSMQNAIAAGDISDRSTNGQAIKNRLGKILAKRNITTIPTLTDREMQMAAEILDPDDIDSSFAQIGGLDHIKQEIFDLAVFPLVCPSFYANSKLRQPPKGVLLFGKPGTGKTMLAKAIAKEAQAIFLPLQLSKILNKYWGESNKLIAATFSLAHKLQPAVIFIDELDTFLKNSNSETAYMDSIKAEFLTLWDGVGTSENSNASRVLVLGATNKPQSIDQAILRRMPRQFEVPLPDVTGRLAILQLILTNEHVEIAAREYLPYLAQTTVGYSGSDLKELCRAASMISIQERAAEFSRRRVMGETTIGFAVLEADEEEPIRPISVRDLELGRTKVSRSGEAAMQYGARVMEEQVNGERNNHNNNNNNIRMDETTMRQLLSLLQVLMKAPNPTTTSNDDRIPNV